MSRWHLGLRDTGLLKYFWDEVVYQVQAVHVWPLLNKVLDHLKMPIVCCPTQRCFFHLHSIQAMAVKACMYYHILQQTKQHACLLCAASNAIGSSIRCSWPCRVMQLKDYDSSLYGSKWDDQSADESFAQSIAGCFWENCEVICLSEEVKSNVTHHVPLFNISTFLKQQLDTCQMPCKQTARTNSCDSWKLIKPQGCAY